MYSGLYLLWDLLDMPSCPPPFWWNAWTFQKWTSVWYVGGWICDARPVGFLVYIWSNLTKTWEIFWLLLYWWWCYRLSFGYMAVYICVFKSARLPSYYVCFETWTWNQTSKASRLLLDWFNFNHRLHKAFGFEFGSYKITNNVICEITHTKKIHFHSYS